MTQSEEKAFLPQELGHTPFLLAERSGVTPLRRGGTASWWRYTDVRSPLVLRTLPP